MINIKRPLCIFKFQNQCFLFENIYINFSCQTRIHQFFLDQVKTLRTLLLSLIWGIKINLAVYSTHNHPLTINNNNHLKFHCSIIPPNQPKKPKISLVIHHPFLNKKNNQAKHLLFSISIPINHQSSAKMRKTRIKN